MNKEKEEQNRMRIIKSKSTIYHDHFRKKKIKYKINGLYI